MTDNEIIKALECCGNQVYSCTDKQCRAKTLGNAVDLINRLQAENEDLIETIHNLTIEKDSLFDKVEELKAEVEGQKALISELIDINNETSDTISELKGTIDKQEVEIERLKDSITDHEYANCVGIKNGLIYTHTLDDYENFIEDVSNEAVKEFAERLKEKDELLELVKHLNKYEHCKKCIHLASCDAWVRHSTRVYDDFAYSVENCPYFKELVGENND